MSELVMISWWVAIQDRLLVRLILVQISVRFCFYTWCYLSNVKVLAYKCFCIPVNINCCRETDWCWQQYKYTGSERCWYRDNVRVWWQTSHWRWIKSSTVCYCVSIEFQYGIELCIFWWGRVFCSWCGNSGFTKHLSDAEPTVLNYLRHGLCLWLMLLFIILPSVVFAVCDLSDL